MRYCSPLDSAREHQSPGSFTVNYLTRKKGTYVLWERAVFIHANGACVIELLLHLTSRVGVIDIDYAIWAGNGPYS